MRQIKRKGKERKQQKICTFVYFFAYQTNSYFFLRTQKGRTHWKEKRRWAKVKKKLDTDKEYSWLSANIIFISTDSIENC